MTPIQDLAQRKQWCPSGDLMDGLPEDMAQFIAGDAPARGYGYGPGKSFAFTTAHGPLYVLPGQWVFRWPDGVCEARW